MLSWVGAIKRFRIDSVYYRDQSMLPIPQVAKFPSCATFMLGFDRREVSVAPVQR